MLYIKLADISVVQIYDITFPFILCTVKHESSCSRTEREREREAGNRQKVKVIKGSQGTDRERDRERKRDGSRLTETLWGTGKG